MKYVSCCYIALICALLFSGCGARDFTKLPEVQAEIEAQQKAGWEFVEMVGEAHGEPEPDGRSIHESDDTGSLTVYAMNSGIDGHGSEAKVWKRTFKIDGFDFLAIKIMTSPDDGYALVFRKPRSSEKVPQPKVTQAEQDGGGQPSTRPESK